MDSQQQQQQQQRRQRQRTLLQHAASHGPYLWSSKDIDNALLWFPSAASSDASAAASVAHDAGERQIDDSRNDDKSNANDARTKDETGYEFLRRLLHSPGSHLPRLAPKKPSSSQGGRRRDNPERGDDFKAHDKTVGKKRKRELSDGSNAAVRIAGEKDDILSTVLRGYYQLFLPRHGASSTTETDDAFGPKPCDTQHDTTDSAKTDESTHAEMASCQLQHDLNSIILSRLRTNELYKAASHQYSNRNAQHTLDKSPKELHMNILIDQYMTHPTTSILRAYTSSLFDRHASLVGQKKDTNPFLRKLLGLARGNEKIQQVVILFLLEPLRRLFVKKVEGWYCKNDEAEQSLRRKWCDSEDTQSTTEEMTSKISLFPLLTSSVSWSDIPQEEIEKECSRTPMPEIIDFILQSASSSHDNKSKDDKEKIPWWILPSPLLCFASQMYFPLACAYLRHWIEAAIVEHGKLYHFDPTTRNHVNKPQSSVLHVSTNGISFEAAILRLRHIRQTSKRLESLFYYLLSDMENDSQGSFEKETMISLGDADESMVSAEDMLFRQRLSWEAIRRAVEK
eukprot:CCRYP_011562-RA/>CCRYP_011562-RA protein AED:0.31 eAED:0.31 QI:0/-1/0/1/-1/1/1/0/566